MKNLIVLSSLFLISFSTVASQVTSVTRAFTCTGQHPMQHPTWKNHMTLDTSNKAFQMQISQDKIQLVGNYHSYAGERTSFFEETNFPGKPPRALYEAFQTIGSNDSRYIIGVEPQILDGDTGLISINYESFYLCE